MVVTQVAPPSPPPPPVPATGGGAAASYLADGGLEGYASVANCNGAGGCESPAGGAWFFSPQTSNPTSIAGVAQSGASMWYGATTAAANSTIYGFLHWAASMSTTMTSLAPGATYKVSLLYRARPTGGTGNNLQIVVGRACDGTAATVFDTSGITTQTWLQADSAPFLAVAPSMRLTIQVRVLQLPPRIACLPCSIRRR